MATQASLTLDTLELLYGTGKYERPTEDTLFSNVTDENDVTFRFSNHALWKKGDLAEEWKGTGTAGEIVKFAEDHPSGADSTVRRAQRQTSAAGGFTAGDVFLKNPPYPAVAVQRALDDVVDTMLWPDAWIRTGRSLDWWSKKEHTGVTGVALTGLLTFGSNHGMAVGDDIAFTSLTGGSGAALRSTRKEYKVLTAPTNTTITIGDPGWVDFVTDITDATVIHIDTDVRYFNLVTNDYDVERVYQYDTNSNINYVEYDQHMWELGFGLDTGMTNSNTGRILFLKGVHDPYEKVYYTAKTKPVSTSYDDMPAALTRMIPWGAAFLLSSQRSPHSRHDPRRSAGYAQGAKPSDHQDDARYFRAVFEDMRRQYRRQLDQEQPPVNRYRRKSLQRRY